MESKCREESLRMRGMNLNPCILRMFEDTLSPRVVHILQHLKVSGMTRLQIQSNSSESEGGRIII